MSTEADVTLLLVHGAWHGAWCWERVGAELADRGVEHVAVDLPGHGDRTDRPGALDGDVAVVSAALDGLDAGVTLVGHSYGGAVISEAGDHPAVERLVYVAAFVPDIGESVNALAAQGPRSRLDATVLEPRDDGTVTVRPEAVGPVFYGDCDPEVVAAASARLVPEQLAKMGTPLRAAAWRERPSTYVLCRRDQAVAAGLQERMARRCDRVVTLDTSHSPFYSAPGALADAITSDP